MTAKGSIAAFLLLLSACRSETSAPQPAPTHAPEAAPPPAAAEPTAAGTASSGAWLDRPLESWMSPGAEIPRPPQMQVDDATKERCKAQNRPPTSPEDRQLVEAGWTLFGPLQSFATTTMASAMATVDANCRPRFMQTFVFKDGVFAGTVSPQPMESRTDGAQRMAFVTGSDFVVAEFARYAPEDPLCCPSRIATVAFRVKAEEPGKPVLVPSEVTHQQAPKKEPTPS